VPGTFTHTKQITLGFSNAAGFAWCFPAATFRKQNKQDMEIYLEQILGTAFGLFVVYLAISHAGKLPAGPTQAQRPGNIPSRPSAVNVPEPETASSNLSSTQLPADIPELDDEELDYVQRRAKIQAQMKVEAQKFAAHGVYFEW